MPITIPPNRKITIEPKQGGGYQSAGLPDGLPPGALTMGTTTKTATSITGVVTDGNGSTSYQIRVNGGTWQSGLTATGLTAETTYSVEWRGVNANGTGPATTPENVTTSAAGSLVHGALASISGAGLPVHGDYNADNYTWSGSRFLNLTFADFDGGKPATNTEAAFKAAFNGVRPGGTGTFYADWESLGTDNNYGKGQQVLAGGPSKSGQYIKRGRAQDGNAVYGWWFRVPALGGPHPFYASFKVFLNWYDNTINPPKIWRAFFAQLSGQASTGNIYLNQAGLALGANQYRANQEYPDFGSLYFDNDPNPGPQGQWNHIEIIGDPLNGETKFYVNGVQLTDADKPGVQIPYQSEIDMSNRTIDFPNTFNQSGGSGNAPAYTPGDVSYADIYLDADRYRLMLTNHATWGSETIREPQPIVSSASSGWNYRVNLGEHISGDGLYYHIVDNYTNVSVESGAA